MVSTNVLGIKHSQTNRITININIPGDALPVRSLLSSTDNAAIADSICERALALILGPTFVGTSIVLTPPSSSKMYKPIIIKNQPMLQNKYIKVC
jgi:hypothetical protein